MKEKNKGNNLKTILIVLAIVLISMISFVGIFVKDGNQMKDIIPEYLVGSDLEGYRILKLKVDDTTNEVIKDAEGNVIESATDEEIAENGYTKTSEPVNSEELLTKENYILAREIISNRLKDLKVSDYKVRQDTYDGSIIVELKEDSNTDDVISNLVTNGKLEMQDNDTGEVLLNSDDIKTAKVLYSTTTSGTTVYLSIEFNKEATKKLEEISNTYVSSTDSEGNTTEKEINLLIDDESILTTSFTTPIANGKLQLSIGSSSSSTTTTDSDTLNEYVSQAQNMAVILKNGKMPLTYTSDSNKYIQTPINEESVKTVLIAAAVVLAIVMLALVIKFKGKGLLAVLSHIGLDAILLLVIRYTNVEIGLGGLIALGLVQLINYILLVMMLKGNKTSEGTKKAIVKFTYRIIPAYIISIVFTFMNFLPIYSFGMVVFWAITIILIYNIFVTRSLIECSKEK